MDTSNLPPTYDEDDFEYLCVNDACSHEGMTYTVSTDPNDAVCPFCEEEMALVLAH